MNIIDRWFGNTPWWLISAGIHAILMLGAGLVAIERMVEIQVMACPILIHEPVDSKLPDDAKIRDFFDKNKTPLNIDAPDQQELFAIDPTAKKDKKLESDDDDPTRERKGDSWDALGYIRGEKPGGINSRGSGAPGMTDILGLGVGGGGIRTPTAAGAPRASRRTARPASAPAAAKATMTPASPASPCWPSSAPGIRRCPRTTST